ncbi:MAG: hypothetical protein M3328_09445 [Chloroflexota bacterium]|nr:hypothetical protein [Chloroflexota bacterium]
MAALAVSVWLYVLHERLVGIPEPPARIERARLRRPTIHRPRDDRLDSLFYSLPFRNDISICHGVSVCSGTNVALSTMLTGYQQEPAILGASLAPGGVGGYHLRRLRLPNSSSARRARALLSRTGPTVPHLRQRDT